MPLGGFQTKTVKVAFESPSGHAFNVPPLLNIERQCRSNWCWAAVALSIARARQVAAFTSQQELVWAVLDELGLTADLDQAECMRPECNPSASGPSDKMLDVIPLEFAGLPSPQVFDRPIDEQTLIDELKAGRPVCLVINWKGGGSHAIAVVGGATDASGEAVFFPGDPMLSGVEPHTYENLIGHYRSGAGSQFSGRAVKAYVLT